MSSQQETFDETVPMVWFRDVGIYNLRAIPTPIGFFSFRELLFVGLGAAVTVGGVAVLWGNIIGEIISLIPVGFMFYFAKKRIKMLPPEMSVLASLFGREERKAPIAKSTGRQGGKKQELAPRPNATMQITFSEKRPVPAQVRVVVPFTGKEAKPIVLFLDGHEVEGTKTSPSRIDDEGVHYMLNFVPDATDVGTRKAQIRFAGSTVPIQEFALEVRSEMVSMV
ncbi:MAG: hypothetical protein M1587_06370 [Thaumarchaeota archaeon]|nr:hypothetical protein [Nitrososphaerota archaeon]MCL5066833.1 hypothetical protein [Nitrososphaerota archaeon]